MGTFLVLSLLQFFTQVLWIRISQLLILTAWAGILWLEGVSCRWSQEDLRGIFDLRRPESRIDRVDLRLWFFPSHELALFPAVLLDAKFLATLVCISDLKFTAWPDHLADLVEDLPYCKAIRFCSSLSQAQFTYLIQLTKGVSFPPTYS